MSLTTHQSAITAQSQPHSAARPFKLSRHFSAVCVVGIGIVVAVMFVLSSQSMTSTLVRQESDQNVALGRTLINTLWPKYAGLARRADKIPPAELVDQIENVQLREDIYRLTRKLNIVKVRIHSVHRQTLFSNWDNDIGQFHPKDTALDKALAGGVESTLSLKPRFEAIDGTVRDRHIVETYMPIDHPVSGERQGVIEIYTDVSAEIGAARSEQLRIAGILGLCMLALYVFLILAVRRAERIMRAQQQALADSEHRTRMLARVVEQSRDSIITRDLDGIITTWNDGAESIFGYTRDEAVGSSMRSLLLNEVSEAEWQKRLAQLRAGERLVIHGWRKTKSGGSVHVVGSSGPLTDETGRLVGDIAVTHDTTVIEKAQQELLRAKEAAEAAARSKSEFLANMSHEIRTPMNGIIGMTNLALDTPLNAEQRDYLSTVKSSADALLQIINDILDLSKIEAGKLAIENIDFSLRESLQQTIRVLAVRAHEKRLELIWSVDAAVPDALIGDPLRIRQIMLNLVGNAIKFTAEGEVEIRVQLDEAREDVRGNELQLRFSVRDTGIGIPADKHNAIFEAFEQADGSTTRQFGGTGLGLSICRRLVNMMGGSITVRAAPGSGSVFEFSLCVAMQRPQPARMPESMTTVMQIPVLIVDDNARSRELLCAYVSSWGMKPRACECAVAAMAQLATARAAGAPFRLVLIDSTLPDADAFTLAMETAGEQTSAIMLADTTQMTAIARTRECRGLHALLKPVSSSTLYDHVVVALDPALHHPEQMAAGIAAAAMPSAMTHSLDVLLVEDNAVNRKLATRLLEKLGHRVAEAHDGAVAVTMTGGHAYDVVLMDMQMPVMDGLAATRAIRARDGKTLPIIALTANAMSGDRERCIEAGMDDYVSKPIEAAALVAALERVAGSAPPAAPAAKQTIAASATVSTGAAYNRKEALARTADDEELLAQIIDIFLEETPPLLAKLGDDLNSGDHESAFRAAHTIKGSSANLSAVAVSAAAHSVELAARGGDLAAARTAYPALQECTATLLTALAAERANSIIPTLSGVLS